MWVMWNKRKNRDRPENWMVEIGQNTEKGPGDLRRIFVSQSPVKSHQLTRVWKALKDNSNAIETTSKNLRNLTLY